MKRFLAGLIGLAFVPLMLLCLAVPWGGQAFAQGPGPTLAVEAPQPDPDQVGAWAGGRQPAQASPHTPRFLVVHWTAGGWWVTFPQYHFCITGEGKVVATYPVRYRAAHVWKHNTGAIGIALCAGAGARVVNGHLVGTSAPIRPVQLEAMAATVAELAIDWNIPQADLNIEGAAKPVPWLTGHHWWAVLDGYGPDRSELGAYEAGVRAKTLWYLGAYRKGRPFQHTRKGGLKRAAIVLPFVRKEIRHARAA